MLVGIAMGQPVLDNYKACCRLDLNTKSGNYVQYNITVGMQLNRYLKTEFNHLSSLQ